ncbi:MAG TPA: aminoglycoside phosphotransferase family protein [Longimicrobiales bacterium]|nr:aminoglycoside phosphotransferase family protein [Longimicrobiales bacterium]
MGDGGGVTRDGSGASAAPWAADRVLTAAAAREAIAGAFPDVDVGSVELLGSGWEFDAYRTADDWIFRFPRRAECAALFDAESVVHELVRPLLAPRFAIPRVERVGAPGPAFPYRFVGHRMVPGVAADHPAVRTDVPSALDVADLLGRIHSVSADEAAARGVPRDQDGGAAWLPEAVVAAPRLADLDGVEGPLAWLSGDPSPPPPYGGPLRLLHDDLCPDHLLVDPESGRLTGLIDWTDAALGDPVLDFLVLRAWRGTGFVHAVLEAYPLPVDRDFGLRLDFLTRVVSLVWLDDARRQGGDVAKHLRWVRRAFEDDGRS